MDNPAEIMPEKRTAFKERFYLYFPGYHVVLRAQIEGKITVNALQPIIFQLQNRHFMLNVHIEIDVENRAWFVRNSSPISNIQEFQSSTVEEWVSLTKKELLEPFVITQGSLYRFLLLYNSSSNITDLIICGHHSVCDGLSLIYLLHDIMELLADPQKSLKIEPAPSLDTVIPLDRVKPPFVFNKIYTRLIKLWNSSNFRLVPQDFTIFQSYYLENPITVLPWELSPEMTTVIQSTTRNHRISVNSVLYTAFLLAQAELQDTSASYYKKLLMPINMRKSICIGDALGFYATGDISRIQINLHNSFWHNAKRVHSRLRKEIKGKKIFAPIKRDYIFPESLHDVLAFTFLCNLLHNFPPKYQKISTILKRDRLLKRVFTSLTQGGFAYAFVLTNLGQAALSMTYGPFTLKSVYLIPPIVFTTEKIMGIVTHGGRITGSLVFAINNLPVSLAEKFLMRTKEILTSITQSS